MGSPRRRGVVRLREETSGGGGRVTGHRTHHHDRGDDGGVSVVDDELYAKYGLVSAVLKDPVSTLEGVGKFSFTLSLSEEGNSHDGSEQAGKPPTLAASPATPATPALKQCSFPLPAGTHVMGRSKQWRLYDNFTSRRQVQLAVPPTSASGATPCIQLQAMGMNPALVYRRATSMEQLESGDLAVTVNAASLSCETVQKDSSTTLSHGDIFRPHAACPRFYIVHTSWPDVMRGSRASARKLRRTEGTIAVRSPATAAVDLTGGPSANLSTFPVDLTDDLPRAPTDPVPKPPVHPRPATHPVPVSSAAAVAAVPRMGHAPQLPVSPISADNGDLSQSASVPQAVSAAIPDTLKPRIPVPRISAGVETTLQVHLSSIVSHHAAITGDADTTAEPPMSERKGRAGVFNITRRNVEEMQACMLKVNDVPTPSEWAADTKTAALVCDTILSWLRLGVCPTSVFVRHLMKALLRSSSPAMASTFSFTLHAMQSRFPSHRIENPWRLKTFADLVLANTLVTKLFESHSTDGCCVVPSTADPATLDLDIQFMSVALAPALHWQFIIRVLVEDIEYWCGKTHQEASLRACTPEPRQTMLFKLLEASESKRLERGWIMLAKLCVAPWAQAPASLFALDPTIGSSRSVMGASRCYGMQLDVLDAFRLLLCAAGDLESTFEAQSARAFSTTSSFDFLHTVIDQLALMSDLNRQALLQKLPRSRFSRALREGLRTHSVE